MRIVSFFGQNKWGGRFCCNSLKNQRLVKTEILGGGEFYYYYYYYYDGGGQGRSDPQGWGWWW